MEDSPNEEDIARSVVTRERDIVSVVCPPGADEEKEKFKNTSLNFAYDSRALFLPAAKPSGPET